MNNLLIALGNLMPAIVGAIMIGALCLERALRKSRRLWR